ncbi:hypothetical protein AB3S75_035037 [Citrus x aurantiifolia]
MASFAISASSQRACSSNHVTKKQPSQTRTGRSLGTKQVSNVVALNVDGQKSLDIVEQQDKSSKSSSRTSKPNVAENDDSDTQSSHPKFNDARWKNGTWDLDMFVKDSKMDWDAVMVAEARRRKFLEMYPDSATNEEPVVFRSSIIPWWAWLLHSYLPQAELLNGRAAMVGFFMGYIVDALTGLDVVGQTGNFICKAGVFVTVAGIILFRKNEDFQNLKNLAGEATLYDKQWQASWQDQKPSGPGKKI